MHIWQCKSKWRQVSLSYGEGNGTPLQYFCLENPMDRGVWWAAVHGVVKSQTWLSDFTFTFHFYALEKEMATHSYSCLENPRDGGAWWAAVYGVAQSWTRLKRLSSSSIPQLSVSYIINEWMGRGVSEWVNLPVRKLSLRVEQVSFLLFLIEKNLLIWYAPPILIISIFI